jgi:VanZ family protein
MFGGLAALVLRALTSAWHQPITWPRAAWAAAVAAAYGIVDEWHQAFVPTRQPDVLDFAADATVACLAVLVLKGTFGRRKV